MIGTPRIPIIWLIDQLWRMLTGRTVNCPSCDEPVRPAAIVCPHCRQPIR